MDKIVKKSVAILIVIVLMSNIFCSTIYAAVEKAPELTDSQITNMDDMWTAYFPNNAVDGIVGILTWLLRAPIAAIMIIFQTVLSSLFWTNGSNVVVSAEDILFTDGDNKEQVTLLSIDYFNLDNSSNSTISSLRKNVAQWYYSLRNIAIVMLLIVLIYIGIRMAISSVAEEKAKYKKMLINWVTSFALLFILHYLMVFVIEINKQFITLLYQALNTDGKTTAWSIMDSLMATCFSISFVKGMASLISYGLLLGLTIALFIQYMIRLFTIGFLIVIAPLITITYSIDKIGDNKSQALDTWLKEFVYNVLIQPFHCIIYIVFVTATYDTMSTGTLTGVVFSAGSILFIKQAEDIVKKIFGFGKASSLGSTAAAGVLAMDAASKLKSSKDKASKAVGKVKSGSSSSKSGNKVTQSRTASNNMKTSNNTNSKGTSSTSSSTSSTGTSSAGTSSAGTASIGSSSAGSSSTGRKIADGLKNFAINEAKFGLNNAGKVMGGLIGAGATGSLLNAYTGAKIGDSMQGSVVNTGRKIKGYAQANIQGLKANINDFKAKKAAKLQQKNAQAKLEQSIRDYEDDGDFDKQIDKEIENYKNGIDTQNVPTERQANLNSAMSELEKAYEQMGAQNAKELAARDAEKIHSKNKINDAVIQAANRLSSEGNYSTPAQIEELTTQIITDIDRLGDRQDYFNSDQYTGMSNVEKVYAKEVYKTKQVMSAIGKTKENNELKPREEVNKRIQRGITRNLEEGKIKIKDSK